MFMRMTAVVFLAVLVAGCGENTDRANAQEEGADSGGEVLNPPNAATRATKTLERFVHDTIDRWNDLLRDRVKEGMSPSEVDQLFHGKYRDRGVVYWGGSGSRTVCYLIDDFVEIHVDFLLDRAKGTARAQERKRWLRLPDRGMTYFSER